jgi:hypothetical protein
MEWCGPPVEEADVAAFERQIGHSLPEDYRRFLLEVNGGRLARENVTFDDGSVNIMLSLGLESQPVFDLLTRTTRERSRRLLPSPDLIPIGYDDGAAPILLGVAGEHRGEVWFENTSNPRPDDANPRVEWFKRRDMKKLADSFEEFLRLLEPRLVVSAADLDK